MRNKVSSTAKSEMSPGLAALLVLMHRYLVPSYICSLPSSVALRLAYFLQVAGEPMGLDYAAEESATYAGSICSALRLARPYLVEGPIDGYVASARRLARAAHGAELLLRARPDTYARVNKVTALIKNFETPFGMNLLSIVHWLAMHDDLARVSPEEAVRAALAWDGYEKSAMESHHIRIAWSWLNELGWLGSK